ncbi:MAG: ABC transporter permease [Acidobacteriota bacterium]|nr:ABC transporter permease [Acidobacteriota bacterium]MDE3043457.1 ABC transporter permease [Acidobacteriota bacterium]MDE3107266.1 ABC transporter permease [Acidobacteriota bacterium]MDE3223636.1 ABC transporter permease [Acidobacteriota bacterium]
MRVYLRYAVKETLGNLWRNRMMTIAAVLTVAVSLSLAGSALLLRQSAAQASAQWQQGTRVTVWMQPNATTSQIANVQGQLSTLPIVKSCVYYTQAQDYQEALKLLPPSESSVLSVAQMPSSFRCIPTVPSNAFVVETTFQNQPGVYKVTAPEQQIREMNHAIRVVQIVFIALASVLLLSAVVLILNTIRMAIFSRRREVSVMKLVGATNWFIRVPYITEGFIQGLIGSVVAMLLVLALHTWYPLHNEFQLGASALVGTEAVVLAVGVVIGSVGSAIAIRRFLDV